MNLEQLKQLDIIARQGTLSSASKILHTSQSALSRSMQRLEAELGKELFSRSKNSVELNEAGLIVVDHARAMLREERFMRDTLDRLTQRESTLLVVPSHPRRCGASRRSRWSASAEQSSPPSRLTRARSSVASSTGH